MFQVTAVLFLQLLVDILPIIHDVIQLTEPCDFLKVLHQVVIVVTLHFQLIVVIYFL